jgi:hypothetical protein
MTRNNDRCDLDCLKRPRVDSGDYSPAVGAGKKIDEVTMKWTAEPNSKSDPVAVADPRETQSLMPATTSEESTF